MRKLAIVVLTFAFGTLTLGYGQSAKVDFSGEWQLDKARSEGLPPGVDQTMTVKQDADRLEVKVRVSGGSQGDQTLEDRYVVNGEAADFKPPMIGGGGGTVQSAKRTAKWATEAKGFDATEQAELDGSQGKATVKATRAWRLSDDAKTLTIEMAITNPDGAVNKSKRVFNKK